MNPVAWLDRENRRDGSRPFVTWYDDITGDRVELSVATVANWVAKAANLLADDLDVEPGTRVGLADPLHWLAPVYLLAAWTLGAAAGAADESDALVPVGDPATFQRAVLAQPDALVVAAAPLAVDEPTELPAAARLLTVLPFDGIGGQAVLAGALAAGGSLVVVRDADAAKLEARCATERVTHTAGVEVRGYDQLSRWSAK